MTSSDSQMYQYETYDYQYFKKKHDDFTLSLVEVNPNESVFDNSSPLFSRAYLFRSKKIRENFGYSLDEWMELPRHIQDIILDASDKFDTDFPQPKIPSLD